METVTTTIAPAKDAAILTAWSQYVEANAALCALLEQAGKGCAQTPAQMAQTDAMDRAEISIQRAIAQTPEGVERQLWLALAHTVTEATDDAAANRCDLAHFLDHETAFDWNVRLIISAIRSLRAMQSQQADTAAWDAALAEYEPTRQRWPQDYDEAEAMPTLEERLVAHKAFTERLPMYQAARDKFMAVPAPTFAALVIKMEIADPVNDEHFELCKIDAQRLAGGAA